MKENVHSFPVVFRLPDVLGMIGLSRASVYRMVQAGTFPQPVRLSPGAVGWMRSEVESWLDGRIAARNAIPLAA